MATAIIQARMGSSRLPQKVLADISGKPMVQHVIERVSAAQQITDVLLATTDQPADTPLSKAVEDLSIPVFRGNALDVLDRYYHAAKTIDATTIVRITADCPLMDPNIVDLTVQTFLNGDFDHASTAYPISTFPDGLDVWVFSFQALERAWQEATLQSEREHVTPYMWKNPHLFKLESVKNTTDQSQLRWTVDEPRDLEFVRAVYRHLHQIPNFGRHDVLNLLQTHPELQEINGKTNRDEGYLKSLCQDQSVSSPPQDLPSQG